MYTLRHQFSHLLSQVSSLLLSWIQSVLSSAVSDISSLLYLLDTCCVSHTHLANTMWVSTHTPMLFISPHIRYIVLGLILAFISHANRNTCLCTNCRSILKTNNVLLSDQMVCTHSTHLCMTLSWLGFSRPTRNTRSCTNYITVNSPPVSSGTQIHLNGFHARNISVWVFNIHPSECWWKFYAHLILLVTKNLQSFDNLHRYDGVLYDTIHEACLTCGLLKDDGEWQHSLDEAKHFQTGFTCSFHHHPSQLSSHRSSHIVAWLQRVPLWQFVTCSCTIGCVQCLHGTCVWLQSSSHQTYTPAWLEQDYEGCRYVFVNVQLGHPSVKLTHTRPPSIQTHRRSWTSHHHVTIVEWWTVAGIWPHLCFLPCWQKRNFLCYWCCWCG